MNKLLLNNKPKDSSNEEFIKAWNNSGYTLEALYNTLNNLINELTTIKKDDFDCPNHYAKLAYNMGQVKAFELIISMLPETAKG
jgi:enoyl-[acyl-carrier-protein] reductase (NADH)